MENINLTSLIEDDSNFLSTGYLEDALIEFSLRFKRLRRHSNQFAPHFSDDLSYWSNWTSNYSTQSEEGFSHASLLTHDVHYSSGDKTESTLKEISEEIINYQETKTLLLEEAISSSILDMSPCFNNYTGLGYSSDTYSIDSSSVDDEREKTKIKKVTPSNGTTKMVYPFGLVKPGALEGDITLKDINRRILRPPTRPIKHPVGDFAARPSPLLHGLGLSGKIVVALTRIQTQGKGTITIIRTKG